MDIRRIYRETPAIVRNYTYNEHILLAYRPVFQILLFSDVSTQRNRERKFARRDGYSVLIF